MVYYTYIPPWNYNKVIVLIFTIPKETKDTCNEEIKALRKHIEILRVF